MDDLTITQVAIVFAALVAFVAYVAFVLRPAWTAYGRVWERFAASFLTLYILVTFAAVGAAVGLGIAWIYTENA